MKKKKKLTKLNYRYTELKHKWMQHLKNNMNQAEYKKNIQMISGITEQIRVAARVIYL